MPISVSGPPSPRTGSEIRCRPMKPDVDRGKSALSVGDLLVNGPGLYWNPNTRNEMQVRTVFPMVLSRQCVFLIAVE
jgi:hypothetical protein